MKKTVFSLFIILILAGCGGGGIGGWDDNSKQKDPQKTADVDASDNKVSASKITDASKADITVHLDKPRDVYVAITSKDNQTVKISSPSASGQDSSARVLSAEKALPGKEPLKVVNFNQNIHNLLHKPSKNSNNVTKSLRVTSTQEGDELTFCTDMDSSYNCSDTVDATARKVVKNISTKQGRKNLVIWVQDSEYGWGGITSSMVDELADTFLQSGSDNDIYDWDTNIYGEEWGEKANDIDSNLIGETDTINILLYKMSNDHLAGYFWAKDNFKQSYLSASNEKIMFYINTTLYKQDKKETFTTLAHEFQHMIHFYQRAVIKDIQDDAWFDEFMSETTEDLLATKINYKGPRHVDPNEGDAGDPGNRGGRYPYFNKKNTRALTAWYGDIYDYGKVSAFGAFLTRNYGGAKLMHDLMYSNKKDANALLEATHKSELKDLIDEWGEAVMLSDKDDLDSSFPRYNFGDFKEVTYDGITYELGSINFFNYDPQPNFDDNKKLNKHGTLYYKVGDGKLSGDIKISVEFSGVGGDVTVITK